MRYNEFINESWPGDEFAKNKKLDNFIKILKDETHPHNKFIKAALFDEKKQMFRGFNMTEFSNSPLIYLNPTKASIRTSANTHNYYTWWIDDIDPRWKNYPKRSKSFICSTNEHISAGYGKNFLMIPTKETTVGICSADDMWNSFHHRPTRINNLLTNLFSMCECDNPTDSNSFLNSLKQINLKFEDIEFRDKIRTYRNYGHKYNYNEFSAFNFDAIKMMEQTYDPISNKFTTISWPTESIPGGNHEIWFSAPCYGLTMDMVIKLKDEFKKVS